VLEVGAPRPCTIVIAENGVGVVLPLPGTALIPEIALVDQISARSYPWPQTAAHAKVNEVDRAYRLGTLFHGDLCHTHEWPTPGPARPGTLNPWWNSVGLLLGK
jgi:hypothetical protein